MTRSRSRAAGLVAGLVVVTLGLAACGSSEPAPGAAASPTTDTAGKIRIVASTDVWASIAREVGGDRVDVTAIIDSPQKDPHDYESTPADAANVGKAQVLIRNGGGYDDFMTKLIDASGNRAPVVDAYTVFQQQGTKPEENEHVWYDVSAVRLVADQVANQLGTVDPAGKDAYLAGASRVLDETGRLYARAQVIGQAHPGASVAVTEPVPDYLLQAAGLKDATPAEFSEAIEEGNDPPAAVVQQTLALFTPQPKVGALVLNAQTQTPATDQIRQAAQQAGVPVVEMTETLPAGQTDYTAWMTDQINRLAAAMDGR